MHLAQLLRCQGRAKVPIALANDRQRLGAELLRLAPVARTTTPLRDQARRTLGPLRLQQPEHLTPLEPQQLRRRRCRQPALIQVPQHLEPSKLAIAHQLYRHPKHPPQNPQEVSSLTGRRVTF